jgi:pimeloyl-ACP methyl ester carboxylesterase
MSSIDVNGIKVNYFAVGAGEPIVLLHCTGGSGRQWTDLAESLRAKFQVVAPDLCGYGGTTHWPGTGTYNLGVEADLVRAVIDRVGKPAHLVGHSFGGAVALQVAKRYPEYLKTLTVIEPVAFHLLRHGDDTDDLALKQVSEVAATIVNAVNCGDYFGATRRFVDFWNGAGAWDALPDPQRVALAARIHKVTLDFWATFNDPMRRGDLFGLTVPALVISGERSPLPTRRISLHLARTLPHVRQRTIASAGHMLPMTHFNEIRDVIAHHCGAEHQYRSKSENQLWVHAPA